MMMMMNSYTSCLFLVSIQLNVLVFLYTVFRKIGHHCRKSSSSSSSICVLKMFPCEEGRKLQLEWYISHVKARGIVNSLASTLIFGLSLDILFSSNLITHPYIGTNQLVLIGLLSLVSLCVFNFMLSVATYRRRRNLTHHVCKYLVGLCALLTSLYLEENPVCALIGMMMVGSVFTDEIKTILQADDTKERRSSLCYIIFISFHLAMNYLCQFFLPVVVVGVIMLNTKQTLLDTQPTSQVVFFLATTFFFWYNIWRLRKLTYNYIAERTNMHTRKMMQIESGNSSFTNISMLSAESPAVREKSRIIKISGSKTEDNLHAMELNFVKF